MVYAKALSRRQQLVRSVVVACVVFVSVVLATCAVHRLPSSAAYGLVSPITMVYAYHATPYILLLIAVLGMAAITLITEYSASTVRWLVVLGVFGCGSAIVFKITHSPDQRDRAFLTTFARRLLTEVSLDDIVKFASALEKNSAMRAEIDRTSRYSKLTLTTNTIPEALVKMYAQVTPYGSVYFTSNEVVREVQVLWGGPYYRWGLEIAKGPKAWAGGIEKETAVPLGSNVTCFLAKD